MAALLSITPWRFSWWVQAPANLLSIFVSPLQNGFTKVLSPIAVKRGAAGTGGGADGPGMELLNTRNLQLELENRQLRAQIESLQSIKIIADMGTPRVIAPSLGLRGSLLQLRTDQRHDAQQVRGHACGPKTLLVPGQQVSGER